MSLTKNIKLKQGQKYGNAGREKNNKISAMRKNSLTKKKL
jgi:hypothetical protein